jgi:protein-S-isoprenylcysteine O-methyltransferase Ste14
MNAQNRIINLVYKIATGSRKVRLFITPIVALSYLIFVSLFVVASLLIERWLGAPAFLPFSITVIIGVPITLAGLLLVAWCLFHFFRVKGTPVPFNPPPKLVTDGPYAYMRNPMLSGLFILLFGLGILFNSVFLIFIFTPLFIAINVTEIKMIEEPELEKRLGKAYLDYKKKTPMFFPRITRSS